MNAQHDLPPIILATNDYNRLLFTAMARPKHSHRTPDFLLTELRRAEVCHPAALPDDVVSTNCRVIYRIDDEPKSRAHLLVHPDDLIWPGAEISVATPLGTALLGLRVGDRMSFLDDDGQDPRGVRGGHRPPVPGRWAACNPRPWQHHVGLRQMENIMMKQESFPPVTISAGDYDRLAFLASFGLNFQQDRPAAAMLANELIRATILRPRDIPPSVATMHSRLEFRDDVTWDVRSATLVYPDEDNGEPDRVSVLSPEGAALIGLGEGQSITWRTPKGWRSLTLLRVLYQPHGRFVEPWRELS